MCIRDRAQAVLAEEEYPEWFGRNVEALKQVQPEPLKQMCIRDRYQGVPKDGFTPMFEHMLDHENIEVILDTDCRDVLKFTGDVSKRQGDCIITVKGVGYKLELP